MLRSGHIIATVLLPGLFLLTGCGSGVEPRVIADRVIAEDRIVIVLTTYPGQPVGDLLIADVEPGLLSDRFRVGETQTIGVENLPAVRVELLPTSGADRITAVLRVHYAGRDYRITVPFRRREVTVPSDGGRVRRWVAGSETVRDLGKPKRTPRPVARSGGA
jgi:hypothetical protein